MTALRIARIGSKEPTWATAVKLGETFADLDKRFQLIRDKIDVEIRKSVDIGLYAIIIIELYCL